jgi:hypothetical protein
MPGAQCTRGRVCKKSTRVSNHRYAAINRHSLRDGFTAYIVLSPGTGLFCPRHFRRNCALRKFSASVGAPGPHAFAVRTGALVSRHRLRPPHPASTSVTIASRPSCEDETAGTLRLILVSEKAKYFLRKGLDNGIKKQPVGQISRATGMSLMRPGAEILFPARLRRAGKGATAPCPPSIDNPVLNGGHVARSARLCPPYRFLGQTACARRTPLRS